MLILAATIKDLMIDGNSRSVIGSYTQIPLVIGPGATGQNIFLH